MSKAGLGGWPRGLSAARFRVESFGAPWRRVELGELSPVRIEEARSLH